MARSSRLLCFLEAIFYTTLLVVHKAESYGLGAPDAACVDMVPQHQQTLQTSPPPYSLVPNVTSVYGGQRITLTLEATKDHLKGFFIQGRQLEDGGALGTFFTDQHKTFTCGKGFNNVVTHSSSKDLSSVQLEWEAPSDFEGDLTFRGTVVKRYITYWTSLRSDKVSIKKRAITVAPPSSNTEGEAEIVEKVATPTPVNLVDLLTPKKGLTLALDNLYKGCDEVKTCYGYPNECASKKDCKFMVTYAYAGSGQYEFELKGKSGGDKYVAVGLSYDEFMGDDSVVVCGSKSGVVDVYMSFNEGNNNINILNPKEGLTILETGEKDGDVYCRFHRREVTSPKNKQFDLKNEKFHVMVAHGEINQDNRLYYHGQKDKIVSKRPVSLGVTSSLKQKNIDLYKKIHACLMIGAWVAAASCGILFARYYKQTWLRSKCCNIDQWFHSHRFFMISTWCLTMTSLILIAYALERFKQSNHSMVGLASIALCFIQPFMAAIRPHPNGKHRSLFNYAHWFVGNSAQILGISAIFLGYEIYLGENPHWVKTLAWYILIAFIAFHCLVHLVLSIAQCVNDRSSKNAEVYPLKEMGGSRALLQPDDGPMDAPGGCFRKFVLALYLPLNWIFTALLIILVVFDKEMLEDQFREWSVAPFWEDL